jgi:hypothetical protein
MQVDTLKTMTFTYFSFLLFCGKCTKLNENKFFGFPYSREFFLYIIKIKLFNFKFGRGIIFKKFPEFYTTYVKSIQSFLIFSRQKKSTLISDYNRKIHTKINETCCHPSSQNTWRHKNISTKFLKNIFNLVPEKLN